MGPYSLQMSVTQYTYMEQLSQETVVEIDLGESEHNLAITIKGPVQ
jgi:hypothetical protein